MYLISDEKVSVCTVEGVRCCELESSPAQKGPVWHNGCHQVSHRQVICQLSLSAGARGGTGSEGLCRWQWWTIPNTERRRVYSRIMLPSLWERLHNNSIHHLFPAQYDPLLQVIWFQWAWQRYLSDCVTVGCPAKFSSHFVIPWGRY